MNLSCVPCYVRSLLFSALLIGIAFLLRGTPYAGPVEGLIVAASLIWILKPRRPARPQTGEACSRN